MALSSTIAAVATAGASVAGGIAAAEAGREQASATRDAAQLQLDAAEKAQALLQKNVDEAISDEEAAQLRREGLISDAEEAQLQALSRAEEGFASALEKVRTEADTGERAILEDIAQSGMLTREELESGVLDAIGQTAGFSEAAISALSPFNEAGLRALKQQQFLAGQLTPEEQQAFTEEFGDPRTANLGARAAAEEGLQRRQRALGMSTSGLGVEQFGQLSADLQQQQFQQAGELTARGQQAATDIAGIQERRGETELALRSQLEQNLAQQRTNELALRTSVQQQGLARNQALGTLGAQQGAQFELQRGDVGAQKSQALSNIAGESAARRSQIRLGSAPTIGQFGMQGANALSQGLQSAAGIEAASSLAPIQGIASGLSALGQLSAFNKQGGK